MLEKAGRFGACNTASALTETSDWSARMADKPLCKIEGCDKPVYGRGWCRLHYRRWYRTGSTELTSTRRGSVQEFIQRAAKSTSSKCITFPFYRQASGYGWVRTPDGPRGAHVYVATLAHGEKPSKKHEACHTCGNGHLGCVNPNHIYWGTKSDNMRDSIAHGTGQRIKYVSGENAVGAKYSDDQIRQVREAIERGERQVDIAAQFGLSQSHISRIKHGVRPT